MEMKNLDGKLDYLEKGPSIKMFDLKGELPICHIICISGGHKGQLQTHTAYSWGHSTSEGQIQDCKFCSSGIPSLQHRFSGEAGWFGVVSCVSSGIRLKLSLRLLQYG